MKKILFIFLFLSAAVTSISHCMTSEQRALMATESLKDHCAFHLIQKIHADCVGNSEAIEARISEAPYKAFDLSGLLAKWYYLIYRCELPKYPEKDYTLSEVLLQKRAKLKDQYSLNFTYCKISNLTGLKNIPGIANTRHILLPDNHLKDLQEDDFDGLESLEMLVLGYNPLTALRPNAFKGASKLQEIFLEHTPICAEELNPEVFQGLTQLKHLYFDEGQFTSPESLNDFKKAFKKKFPNLEIHVL